jgi:hypothetical protein
MTGKRESFLSGKYNCVERPAKAKDSLLSWIASFLAMTMGIVFAMRRE